MKNYASSSDRIHLLVLLSVIILSVTNVTIHSR